MRMYIEKSVLDSGLLEVLKTSWHGNDNLGLKNEDAKFKIFSIYT